MECSKVQGLLSEYVDDMLEESLNKEIQSHLSECKECKLEYDMLNMIINNCSQFEEEDLPLDFENRLHEKLVFEASDKVMGKSRFNSIRKYYAVAALLVLVISFGILMNSGILNLGAQKKSESVAEMAPAAAPAPQTAENAGGNSVLKSESKAMGIAPAMDNTASDRNSIAMAEMQPSTKESTFSATMVLEYSVGTISLNDDEYKAYYDDIVKEIEDLQGFAIKDQPNSYKIPNNSLVDFTNRLKEKYNIADIQLTTRNISDEISNLETEISDLENKKSDSKGAEDNKVILEEKRGQLEELRQMEGYDIIQINRM